MGVVSSGGGAILGLADIEIVPRVPEIALRVPFGQTGMGWRQGDQGSQIRHRWS